MYVYHDYFNAKRVALVYPGGKVVGSNGKSEGSFLHPVTIEELDKKCSIISILVDPKINRWQEEIYKILIIN